MKKLIFAICVLLAPTGAFADELTESRVKELVLEAILENPEIIFQAVAIIEDREKKAQAAASANTLASEREILERDPNAPVIGNPDGDVTVVEFFDYNCPYCKRVKPHMEALLAADKNVRVVYREWPILGEGSTFAARAALASRKQGKYEEFHWAMMGLNARAEESTVLRAAGQVGIDIGQLRRDMNSPAIDEHIQTSMRLARALGFSGTPSFVIGDALAPGLIDGAQMIDMVEKARNAQ